MNYQIKCINFKKCGNTEQRSKDRDMIRCFECKKLKHQKYYKKNRREILEKQRLYQRFKDFFNIS